MDVIILYVFAADPGLCTMSRSTLTASSLLIFSKFMSFTYERERGKKQKLDNVSYYVYLCKIH